ncbi:hypothetical protein PENTCL1PPCAC_24613, partial [Pristionchus entomophagus]
LQIIVRSSTVVRAGSARWQFRSDLLSLFFEFDRVSCCCLIDGGPRVEHHRRLLTHPIAGRLLRESISVDSKILVKRLTGTVGEDVKKPSNE